jgi:hypothetical protein
MPDYMERPRRNPPAELFRGWALHYVNEYKENDGINVVVAGVDEGGLGVAREVADAIASDEIYGLNVHNRAIEVHRSLGEVNRKRLDEEAGDVLYDDSLLFVVDDSQNDGRVGSIIKEEYNRFLKGRYGLRRLRFGAYTSGADDEGLPTADIWGYVKLKEEQDIDTKRILKTAVEEYPHLLPLIMEQLRGFDDDIDEILYRQRVKKKGLFTLVIDLVSKMPRIGGD